MGIVKGSVDDVIAWFGGTVVTATKVTVNNTSGGKDLAALKASALSTHATHFRLKPESSSADIRYNPSGSAGAACAKMSPGGMILRAAQASSAKFYAASDTDLALEEVQV